MNKTHLTIKKNEINAIESFSMKKISVYDKYTLYIQKNILDNLKVNKAVK